MNTHLRRLGGLTVAAALMVSLSACSNDKPETFRTPTATGAPSASGTASGTPTGTATSGGTATPEPTTIVDPDTGEVDYCKGTKQAPFTGEAADTFGAENVMAAYCEMGNFSLSQGFTNLMETKATRGAVEFSFVKPWMTPKAQKVWDAAVAKTIKGDDEQAPVTIMKMTGFNFENDGFEFAKDLPRVGRKSVTAATTAVDKREGGQRLAMRMVVKADLLYKKAGDPKTYTVAFAKDTTYWLVPNGDAQKPWLIDGWEASFDSKAPVASK